MGIEDDINDIKSYLENELSKIIRNQELINQKFNKLIGKERKGFVINEELKADRAENLDEKS